MTYGNLVKIYHDQLEPIYGVSESKILISIVLQEVAGYTKVSFLLQKAEFVPSHLLDQMDKIIRELVEEVPIQYILGKADFFGLVFFVSRDVLIPRQETEELVNWVIEEYVKKPVRILDIGTGSGCIAISLASKLPEAVIEACDISATALKVAKKNADLNAVNVNFFEMDILQPTRNIGHVKYDIIVCNPPYVREKEKELMKKNVLDHEPGLALFVADDDPLVFYKAVKEFSSERLLSQGKIYFEINENLSEETAGLFLSEFKSVIVKKDINGKSRMLQVIKK